MASERNKSKNHSIKYIKYFLIISIIKTLCYQKKLINNNNNTVKTK